MDQAILTLLALWPRALTVKHVERLCACVLRLNKFESLTILGFNVYETSAALKVGMHMVRI